ncbi:MAG: phenylacetate--CoA ligase family protein, partial [Clostridiales bacterium]|nr:phenylacetate--CoA ligase family protein [Clostridiales bacterium]
MFPGQIDDILKEIEGASSEYQVFIDHENGKDKITVFVETTQVPEERKNFEKTLKDAFKSRINIGIIPKAVEVGDLPRSEKKSTRIYDYRY